MLQVEENANNRQLRECCSFSEIMNRYLTYRFSGKLSFSERSVHRPALRTCRSKRTCTQSISQTNPCFGLCLVLRYIQRSCRSNHACRNFCTLKTKTIADTKKYFHKMRRNCQISQCCFYSIYKMQTLKMDPNHFLLRLLNP